MNSIVCWNVNSVNSRLEHLCKLMQEQRPEVILLQELKCLEEKFPYEALDHYGYNYAVFGQKSYNGVAILSKSPIEDLNKGLPADNGDARYIEAVTQVSGKVIRVASIYVPNGQEIGSDKFSYKMDFFAKLEERFKEHLRNGELLVFAGDYNVAPESIDVYNPKSLDGSVGFHIDERRWFRRFCSLGLQDSFRALHPSKQQFSWWDYRSGGWQHNKGMRIDHILVCPELLMQIEDAGVLSEYRALTKASDHAPIYIKL
jgi:exodeoxyribonuclease-3